MPVTNHFATSESMAPSINTYTVIDSSECGQIIILDHAKIAHRIAMVVSL